MNRIIARYKIKTMAVVAGCFIGLPALAQQPRPAAGVYFPPHREIQLADVDCDARKQMLENIFDSDQENRRSGKEIDEEIDYQNQVKVVSLIEKCGWPERREVGAKAMNAVFLVLQHASAELRQKYFPMIKASAEKGDLPLRVVAMMEDRMLMENGKKQKYGTQLVSHNGGPMKLHPIEDPATLNERRAAMGMEPIEEYLKHFGLEYRQEEP